MKGHHLWAERYDRKLEDIFAVQDEVAHKVVSELAVTLKATEEERLFRKYTNSLDAYDLYLRATRAWSVPAPTKQGILKARKLYERLVELDPKFAGGYAGLSFMHSLSVRLGSSTSPREDIEKAFELAQKAVSVDDTWGFSYTALGSAYLMKRQYDQAIAAVRKAIELEPSDAKGYLFLGFYLHWSGRSDEVIQALKRAQRLNPQLRNPAYISFLGYAYFTARRYEESIVAFKEVVDRSSPTTMRLAFLTASYREAGRDEEARQTAQVLLKKFPKFTLASFALARTYKNPEDTERLLNALRKAGLPH